MDKSAKLCRQSVAAADEARASLVRFGVDPTPAHYELWYTHAIGVNAALSAEIARRLAAGDRFDAELCAKLYAHHLAHSELPRQVLDASETIARELAGLATMLRGAGKGSETYGAALSEAAAAFESNLDASSLRGVLNGLAAATRDMARRNDELSEKMSASTRQVEALQQTLQHVKVEALTDGLTGLANRRAFDEALRENLERSGDLCLIMCDIDHFKRVNDTWGHGVGDQVIRFIARILRDHGGGGFLAARYGGEEFALIMPGVSMHRAQEIAASLRQAIKAKRLTRKSTGEMIGAVTVSIGIARRRGGDTASALLERADLCLYASKQAGRDRATIDSDLTPPTR